MKRNISPCYGHVHGIAGEADGHVAIGQQLVAEPPRQLGGAEAEGGTGQRVGGIL